MATHPSLEWGGALLCAALMTACVGDLTPVTTPGARVELEVARAPGPILSIVDTRLEGILELAAGGERGGEPILLARRPAAWEIVALPSEWSGPVRDVWTSRTNDVWIIGDGGRVAHGALGAFARVGIPGGASTGPSLNAIWGFGEQVWIAGDNVVWRGDTKGLESVPWSMTSSTTGTSSVAFSSVWSSATDDAWIVGERGTALRWDGEALRSVDLGTTAPLRAVHGVNRLQVAMVGGSTAAVALRYDGLTWRRFDRPGMPPLHDVWIARDGVVWVSGEDGFAAWWDGLAWTVIDGGVSGDVLTVRADPSSATFGGLESGEPALGFIFRFLP